MAPKPKTAAGYPREQTELVTGTCLYVATLLGDLMESVVVVGGLVPSLLIDQQQLAPGVEPHPGTLDLDIGLHAAVLDEGIYQAIADRLRAAGFEQGQNEAGNATRQTWKISVGSGSVTVDFLIPPTLDSDKGGRLRNLQPDFAAIIAPGLHLAFKDRVQLDLAGVTILGETARRDISVAGPGAFIVLKALAFRIRGENKDAFDLYYVGRNYGEGPADVARALAPLLGDDQAEKAVEILRQDFTDPSALGPKRASNFLFGRDDDALQADVVGVVLAILSQLQNKSPV